MSTKLNMFAVIVYVLLVIYWLFSRRSLEFCLVWLFATSFAKLISIRNGMTLRHFKSLVTFTLLSENKADFLLI